MYWPLGAAAGFPYLQRILSCDMLQDWLIQQLQNGVSSEICQGNWTPLGLLKELRSYLDGILTKLWSGCGYAVECRLTLSYLSTTYILRTFLKHRLYFSGTDNTRRAQVANHRGLWNILGSIFPQKVAGDWVSLYYHLSDLGQVKCNYLWARCESICRK